MDMRFLVTRLSRPPGACLAGFLCLLSASMAGASGPAAGDTGSADGAWPAARRHVRMLEGTAYKFTSKLATLVELNFTMNFGHQAGKVIITNSLTRMANRYGVKVDKFTTGVDGSTLGLVPDFTVDDLLAGEVIVANNISGMGDAAIGTAKQSALRTAIETHGRGYLAFHGSGENLSNGWSWFTNTLHPLSFQGHSLRSPAPVYKHLAEARHVVLEGILDTNTTPATVPDELDASGNEVLAQNVPTRLMKSEWFRWGRDITRDPAYRDKVTLLLKFDARMLGRSELDINYHRKGGNLFSYLYRVGAGMTSYLLSGHENDELLDRNTGFDGGVGDFDRYVAQTLFFLAGYDTTVCDASCEGLPMVDSSNRLVPPRIISEPVGARPVAFPESMARLDPVLPGFSHSGPDAYEAVLRDGTGKTLSRAAGVGPVRHVFDSSRLEPGVYVLTLRSGGQAPRSRRYAVMSGRR